MVVGGPRPRISSPAARDDRPAEGSWSASPHRRPPFTTTQVDSPGRARRRGCPRRRRDRTPHRLTAATRTRRRPGTRSRGGRPRPDSHVRGPALPSTAATGHRPTAGPARRAASPGLRAGPRRRPFRGWRGLQDRSWPADDTGGTNTAGRPKVSAPPVSRPTGAWRQRISDESLRGGPATRLLSRPEFDHADEAPHRLRRQLSITVRLFRTVPASVNAIRFRRRRQDLPDIRERIIARRNCAGRAAHHPNGRMRATIWYCLSLGRSSAATGHPAVWGAHERLGPGRMRLPVRRGRRRGSRR